MTNSTIYVSIYPSQFHRYRGGKSGVVLKLGSTNRFAAERARETGGMASFSPSVELIAWRFSISLSDRLLENIENGLRREITEKRDESDINYNYYAKENFIVDYSQVELFLNFIESLLQNNENLPRFSRSVEYDNQRKNFLRKIPVFYQKSKDMQHRLLTQRNIDPFQCLGEFNKFFSEILPNINESGYWEWRKSLKKKPTENRMKLFKDEEPKFYYDNVLTSSASRVQRKLDNSIVKADKDKKVDTSISDGIENTSDISTPKVATTTGTTRKNKSHNLRDLISEGDLFYFNDRNKYESTEIIPCFLYDAEKNLIKRYYPKNYTGERDEHIYKRVEFVKRYRLESRNHNNKNAGGRSDTWPWIQYFFIDKECTMSMEKVIKIISSGN